LRTDITALLDSGAQRFDPVRFCYIEAMARRALDQAEPVARMTEDKALAALHQYRTDLLVAQEEAAAMVVRATADFPDAANNVQQLFEHYQFRAIKQLMSRLRRQNIPGLVAELTSQVTQSEGPAGDTAAAESFDDILRQQENDVVTAMSESAAVTNNVSELKSVRHFRQSLEKISIDKLVARAMKEVPEDAGPLNPQMLVIRSLTTMRELSPQYLNRFVSYMDTLLWLEQADENLK
jgi:hypothetical protein